MGTHMRASTESRIRQSLHARKLTQGRHSILCVLGVIVVLGVVSTLMQSVLAAKSKDRVLDCHVSATVAHHHTSDCYDKGGDLVCTLPERDLHKHDKSCYERKLTCTTPEGEGAHHHDDSCRDADGNLICGLEESDGHQHADACYADVLVCGKEEVTEEHVHGDNCFRAIKTDDDADQTAEPKSTFYEQLKDKDDKPQVAVDVVAPEGALPKGATMEAELVGAKSIDKDVLQKAIDEKAGKLESLEPGRVLDFRAVDISFKDSEGKTIEPKKDVTVKLTSELAESEDATVVLHMEDDKDGSKTASAAEVVDMLSEKQLLRRGYDLNDDQVAFDASHFSTYVLATTSKSNEMSSEQGSATIKLNVPAEAGIPADATLEVSEIAKADEDYDGYLDRSAKATEIDRDEVGLARFFDITILDAEGNEIQPAVPVDATIELSDIPAKTEDFKLVHFAEDADGNEAKTPEEVKAGGKNGTTTFTAESFSVYGVIYTVDFGYEVGDKTYELSIKGGDSLSMAELADQLHIYENAGKDYDTAEKFVKGIDKVEFSNPDLIWVGKVEGKKIYLDIREEHKLEVEYPANLTDAEWRKIVNKEYTDEWVLLSVKPFSTTESLTITMDDGSQLHVKVTDDAPHDDNNRDHNTGTAVVDTIANPGTTTIDLFDYWAADSSQGNGRSGWPGHRNGEQDFTFERYNHNNPAGGIWNENRDSLRGQGHWKGINWNGPSPNGYNQFDYGPQSSSHPLKFVPGAAGTVWDNNGEQNRDNNDHELNSYIGDAKCTQGIVANNLGSDGYPVLSGQLGGNTESLAYLFNHDDTTVNGKKVYRNVDHFLYIDRTDGYYTYDSNEVQARYDESSNTFKESLQPRGARVPQRGFWPFGERNWHFGMHVQTRFVQPENGQVPNKDYTGTVPMEFRFAGDDDAWVFIDGKLVGDAGGIHNGTSIHIDFSNGEVLVTARDDGNGHAAQWDRPTSLSNIFDASELENGTFKAGTYHTFDFFYLERGGSESNILLKYNLLSTTDFEAKKKYIAEDKSSLRQDQFKFSLIGLDGRYNKNGGYAVEDGHELKDEKAIMPSAPNGGWEDSGHTIPRGSSNQPSLMYLPNYEVDLGVADPNDPTKNLKEQHNLQMYTTGNLAGSSEAPIQFGRAMIPKELQLAYEAHSDDPPRYRYIVMEHVPANAYNAQGKKWADATDEERRAGGFYNGTVLYDTKVYYMECVVATKSASSSPSDDEFYLKQIFYKDGTFTEKLDDQDVELEFTNKYVKPLNLVITKTNDTDNEDDITYLKDAEFELTYAEKVSDNPVKYQSPAGGATLPAKTDANGKASLYALPPGTYLLRETKAPDGYKQCDTIWLLDYQEVDTPEPHIEPVITELNADGTMPANPKVTKPTTTPGTVMQGGNEIQVNTASLRIKNEQNAAFRFKVQKLWDGIEGTDAALDDSEVTVKLGRYKVGDKLGKLIIEKSGVPAEAHGVIIFYTVDKMNPDYTTTEYYSGWYNATWPADGPYRIELPVEAADDALGTTYKVTETVYSDDPRYDSVHNPGSSSTKWVNVRPTADGTAAFTATYTMRENHIFLKTTLNDGGRTVDTSNVTYTLYNMSVDPDNPVGTWSYDAVVNDAGYDPDAGLDLGAFPAGDYRMVESGWPVVANSEVDHDPEPEANGTSAYDFRLTQDAPETAEFGTTYHDRVPCEVQVFFYKKGDDTTVPATPDYTTTVYGDKAQLVFQAVPGSTDYTDATRSKGADHVIAGNGLLDTRYDIQWDAYTDGTALTRATIDLDLPARTGTQPRTLVVYIGSEDDDFGTFAVEDCTEVTRSALANAGAGSGQTRGAKGGTSDGKDAKGSKDAKATSEGNRLMAQGGEVVSLAGKSGGATKLGAAISAGHVAIPTGADSDPDLFMLWDGQGRPQAPAGKTYVDDEAFNDQGYTITLSKSDADTTISTAMWEKEVEDSDKFPALDANGDAYVYYIMGVRELEMPKGTECTIVKDGDKQQVSKYIDQDTDPAPLQVKNKVGQPTDVELIKVDKDVPTKTLAGAKFHVEMQDEDTQQWVRMKGNGAPAVKVIGTGTDVTLDSDGVFEVPTAGVVVKDLEPGTYRFVEDACPAGYVMDDTEFEFEVGQDGVITSAYKAEAADDCITVKIPNTPGSELPHAGGIGTTLFTVAGCALMAAGVLMLLKRRRCEA